MNKPLEDYLRDPRIEPDEPDYLKQVHAIRLKIQDERAGLSSLEYARAARQETEKLFAQYNIKAKWATYDDLYPGERARS